MRRSGITGPEDGPPSPSKLDGELLVGQMIQPGLTRPKPGLTRPKPGLTRPGPLSSDLDRRGCVELGLLELVDEGARLVAGESSGCLPLGEPHGASCVAEIGMAGFPEKAQECLNLPSRSRWARLLTECHDKQSCRCGDRTGLWATQPIPADRQDRPLVRDRQAPGQRVGGFYS